MTRAILNETAVIGKPPDTVYSKVFTMKVLFIARTYPPIIGGMQRFANDFYNNYKEIGDIDLLANAGGNKTIVFFVIKLLLFLMLKSNKYDIVHFSDAVLSPLILVVRFFSRAKVSFTVHGLDIVYSRFGYQKIIIPFLKKADKIFSVSQFTMTQCLNRGISAQIMTVIPNCLNFGSYGAHLRPKSPDMMSRFNIDLAGKKVLLTVGRLIERKGHLWFLSSVFNKLPSQYVYIIAGDGPEKEAIKKTIENYNLADRVYLLGLVSDEEKKILYQISDLFIMPNIRVKGDQEGFGIVLLEAGGNGLPVIGSNLEGIRDAILDGVTGRLVDEKDEHGFIDAIVNFSINTSSIAKIVVSTFDCQNIIKTYHSEFEKLCHGENLTHSGRE